MRTFQTGKADAFTLEILARAIGALKRVAIPKKKKWFVAGICLMWKLIKYANN